MKALRAIGLYAVGVLLVGALLAPWLFWLLAWGASHISGLAWTAEYPFRRVFNRSMLLVALAGLWPLLGRLECRSWSTLGFVPTRGWWRQVLFGAGLGVGSVLVAWALAGRALTVDRAGGVIAAKLMKVLFTAGAVALIEETFFRGGLLGALRRGMPWLAAVLVSSLIYSALHFLKPSGPELSPDSVRWWSGLACVGESVGRSFRRVDVLISFVSLLMAGCVLGWAFVKSGGLYLPMGLHAGWVVPHEMIRWLHGGNLTETPTTWVALVMLWLAVAWWCQRRAAPSS